MEFAKPCPWPASANLPAAGHPPEVAQRQAPGPAARKAARPGKHHRMKRSRAELLGIYLNDHLAGSTVGTELAHRIAHTHDEVADQATLQRLAGEINADRRALIEIMALLGVPVRRYKAGAAWLAEKAGRLKLNGYLTTRSPLSSLEELELLRLGVEGKAAGWRTLRELAETDPRLSATWLDELLARARSQIELLEDLRVRAATHLIEVSS